MSSLFDKLHKAVPISDLQQKHRELVLEKSRKSALEERVKKDAVKISDLETKLRNSYDHEEKTNILKEEKESLEEEFEIVTRGLERYDPTFKWVNSMYRRIANILHRAEVTPLQAFEAFDRDMGGTLDKNEFQDALITKL